MCKWFTGNLVDDKKLRPTGTYFKTAQALLVEQVPVVKF